MCVNLLTNAFYRGIINIITKRDVKNVMSEKNTVNRENPRDLPGLKKKSFSMYFGGGEIWFEHLDGMYENTFLAIEKLTEDYETFKKPSKPSLICFNIDYTDVNDELIKHIVNALTGGQKRFTRVAFVGADRKTKNQIKKSLKCREFALEFINDFEKAKEWLTSEEI